MLIDELSTQGKLPENLYMDFIHFIVIVDLQVKK